jgi:hydrogenase maturation protease
MKRINPDRMEDTLIIGIGNISRGDDGLGWVFLDILDAQDFTCEKVYRYQLSLEDAEMISRYSQVIFVDASIRDMDNGCRIKRVINEKQDVFFSHHLPPDTVLNICSSYFQKNPKAWLLEIEGYSFDLGDGLSTRAKINLKKALDQFKRNFIPFETVELL